MNYMLLSTVLYGLIFLLVYFSSLAEEGKPLPHQKTHKGVYAAYLIVLCGIFVAQMATCTISRGYENDFGLFRAWTSFGDTHKLSEFYTVPDEIYVDYPPVFLYVLYGMGKLASLFGIPSDSTAYMYFMRFPAIACDAATSLLIFFFARKRIGEKHAVVFALLSAINPANIINSTVWGQVDSFSTLTIAGLLLCLFDRRYVGASVLMAVTFLTKPQNIIYAPVFGLTFLFDWAESRRITRGESPDDASEDRERVLARVRHFPRTVLWSVLAFLAALLLIPLPITGGNLWLVVERYLDALGLYPYTTLNACNLYGAVGMNAVSDMDFFLFLPVKVWGFVFIALMICALIWLFARSRSRTKILYGGTFTVATIYMLAHNMHERYLYPVLLLTMLVAIVWKQKKLLWLYAGFSLVHFWNEGLVLKLAADSPNNPYFGATDPGFVILCWVHLILYGILVYIGYRHYLAAKRLPVQEGAWDRMKAKLKSPKKPFALQEEQEKVHITRVDLLLIAGLMLVYSLFAFFRLGSNNTPQTGWYLEAGTEQAVFTFAEAPDIQQVYLHCGWMDRRKSDQDVKRILTIEQSADGETWTQAASEEIKDVFHFWHFDVSITQPYVRFTLDDGRVYINEAAFYGATEEERYTPERVEGPTGNETVSLMLDEPDRMVYRYTWYDETYFDEIYHPRTAYENLTHRYPYENTHPPLGKLIIAAGMQLFGVTPFGWRFFGTLAGVLMVPLAYLMGKRMFKQTRYALFTALLFTFDFMHLSQTRLATIDSFTTLFTMGAFYYMYQYYIRSFYNVGVKGTLYPLAMSGLFFGLSVATKWQGAYAGVGLAVLFFMSLIRRYREYRYASERKSPDARMQAICAGFWRKAGATLGYAVLFFVVVPGIIYFVSYIPAMNTPVTGLSFFWENQFSMFNYHSTLDATHAYGSPWWQWPLDIRPLYSYAAPSEFLPEGTSMGMASFGNPLVWWMMIPAFVACVWYAATRRGSKELTVIFVGFAAMYGPWVFVTRVCFIYHFFPVVIFGVLMIVYCIQKLLESRQIRPWVVYTYLGLVVLLFLAFYPVLTGMLIPRWYMEALRWLPTWVFG